MTSINKLEYDFPKGNKNSIGYINSDKTFCTSSDDTYGDVAYVLKCNNIRNDGSSLLLDVGRQAASETIFTKLPTFFLDIPIRIPVCTDVWSILNSTYNSFFNPSLTSIPETSKWVEINIPFYDINKYNSLYQNRYSIATPFPFQSSVNTTPRARNLKVNIMQAAMTIAVGTQYDDIFITYTYRGSLQIQGYEDEKMIFSGPGYVQFRFDKNTNTFVTNGVTVPTIDNMEIVGPLAWGLPKTLSFPGDQINPNPAYSSYVWNKRIIQGIEGYNYNNTTTPIWYSTQSKGCLVDICRNSNTGRIFVACSQVGNDQTAASISSHNKTSIVAYAAVSVATGYVTPSVSKNIQINNDSINGALTYLHIETETVSNKICLTYSQTKDNNDTLYVSSYMKIFDGNIANMSNIGINGQYSNLYSKPYNNGFLLMARDLFGNIYLGKYTLGQTPNIFQFKPSQRIISGVDPVAFIKLNIESGMNESSATYLGMLMADFNNNINREGRDDTISMLSILWSYDHFIRIYSNKLEINIINLTKLNKVSISIPTVFDNYVIQTPDPTRELLPYVSPSNSYICSTILNQTIIQSVYGQVPTYVQSFNQPLRELTIADSTYVGWWTETGLIPDDSNGVTLPLIINDCSGIARAQPHPLGYRNLVNNSVEVPVSSDTLYFNPEYAGNATLYSSSNGSQYYWFRARDPVKAYMVVWNPLDGTKIMDKETEIFVYNYTPTGIFTLMAQAYIDTTNLYDGSRYYTEDNFNLANIPYHLAIYNNKDQYLYHTGTFNLTPPGTSGTISAGNIKKTSSRYVDFTWTRRVTDPYTNIHTVLLHKGDEDPKPLAAQIGSTGPTTGIYKVSTDGLSLGDKIQLSYIAARKGTKISSTNRYSDVVYYVKGHKYNIDNVTLTIDGSSIPASSLKKGTLEILNSTGLPATISITFDVDNEGFDTTPYAAADVIPQIRTAYLIGTKIPMSGNRKVIPTRHPDFPQYTFRQTIPTGAASTYPNINNLGISWILKQPGFYVKKAFTTETSLSSETLSTSIEKSGTYKLFILIVDEYGSGSLFDITNPNNNYKIEIGT